MDAVDDVNNDLNAILAGLDTEKRQRKDPRVLLSLTLPLPLFQRLADAAEARGLSRNRYANELLEKALA